MNDILAVISKCVLVTTSVEVVQLNLCVCLGCDIGERREMGDRKKGQRIDFGMALVNSKHMVFPTLVQA